MADTFFVSKLAIVLDRMIADRPDVSTFSVGTIAYRMNVPSPAACRMEIGKVLREERERVNERMKVGRVTRYRRDGNVMVAEVERIS